VFFTYHPAAEPDKKLGQIHEVDRTKGKGEPHTPWPSLALQKELVTVLSIRCDTKGHLWALDFTNHGETPPALISYNLADGSKDRRFEFPAEIAGKGSMLNDFAISDDGKWIFIADTSIGAATPALVVYDVVANTAKRHLHNHTSVQAKLVKPMVNGEDISPLPPIGVDSIALSKDHLYFAAIYDTKLWRLPVASLTSPTATPASLVPEAFAEKTASDGIIAWRGKIFITDFEHSAISVLDETTRKMHLLVQDEGYLRWPDGLSVHNDKLYVSCSAIHQVLTGNHREEHPFHVVVYNLKTIYEAYGPARKDEL